MSVNNKKIEARVNLRMASNYTESAMNCLKVVSHDLGLYSQNPEAIDSDGTLILQQQISKINQELSSILDGVSQKLKLFNMMLDGTEISAEVKEVRESQEVQEDKPKRTLKLKIKKSVKIKKEDDDDET